MGATGYAALEQAEIAGAASRSEIVAYHQTGKSTARH